ncbi:MAG TPA: hypothetical protein VK181_20920 [Rhizobium sp.]|nr:hypothetical protein [Rhizobium sp.]
MARLPLYYPAVVVLQTLRSEPLHANDATDVFECSILAEWAGFKQQSEKLAQFGFRAAQEDAQQALDVVRNASRDEPNFLQERSPEFWIGMWYGRSQARVEEWLQTQQPMPARAGAAAPERVMLALQKLEVWKPIAAQEFEQRACGLRLLAKD